MCGLLGAVLLVSAVLSLVGLLSGAGSVFHSIARCRSPMALLSVPVLSGLLSRLLFGRGCLPRTLFRLPLSLLSVLSLSALLSVLVVLVPLVCLSPLWFTSGSLRATLHRPVSRIESLGRYRYLWRRLCGAIACRRRRFASPSSADLFTEIAVALVPLGL